MSRLRSLVLVAVLSVAAAAQSAEPPLNDTRLTVHTLVREDIFAGFMSNDMDRLAKGEKNVAQLLQTRPNDRGVLLTWQAGATTFRAVKAREAGQAAEYDKLQKLAASLFDQAAATPVGLPGVAPVLAPSTLLFADRLAPADRPAAYARAYDAYKAVWAQQGQIVDNLPVHMKGELLGGLAQSAQRTGRADEMNQYLDKMLVSLAGTPYEAAAKMWKDNPQSAGTSTLLCKNCHDAGRLDPTLARLAAAPATP